ncbi:MAG TPA: PAS domain S-box protein, partial [Candidatus Melainabacteria bacterium]|nr:PAS domain S-box protein [Candidatus Melainabacteria bacterium]
VPIIQALMKNDRIMISPETVDYRDVPVLAATRYIPELDWGLVAKIDRKEALAPVNNLIYTILLVTLAISIVVILVGFYLSGSIAAPVVNLASAVRKIKEGELSVRASVTSDDEIGELAESFNAMVSSLNEQQRQLLLLKRAIDASSDLVWIADRVDGTQLITYASETADRVCGYSAEELTGKNPIEVFGGVKDVDEKNSKRFEDAIIRGEAFSGELLNRTKDGRVYWTRLELVPVTGEDGETSCVAGIARDVTIERDYQAALEQSEEQFRQAMQYSPIGMALLSPGGRWLEVNKAVCEIFGYTEAELLTTDFQTMTHPEDLEGDLENVQRLLDGEIKSYFMEKRYVNKGGETIWCQLSVSLVLNEDGSPKYFISQIQDITESKRARQELLETNAELEEFAYRTSHDLRSPLISSISLLGVTRNSIKEGNFDLALQSIDHAQSSLNKLERLVQDILTLTATKSVVEEVEEIEVKDMVDGIRNSLSHLEGYDRVEFIESFEAPERINVGKGRFQLIVENLISNAIKYQDPNKEASFIKISTARNNGEFCFSVEDNGLGVPEEKQGMLFTMFKRFHPRTSFGSGLGLYMIKKSAEKLGGRIEYEGKNGGSEFRLILPWESKN